MDISDQRSRRQEQVLFRAVVDGTVSDTDFQRLEALLAEDPALRARYIRFVDLEAGLYDELSTPCLDRFRFANHNEQRSHRFDRWMTGLLAACLTIAVVMIVHQAWSPRPQLVRGQPEQKAVESDPEESDTQPVASTSAQLSTLPSESLISFEEVVSLSPEPVAIVTRVALDAASGTGRSALKVGDRLVPGLLNLPAGEVSLEFLNGAQVVIRGPARFQIRSLNSVVLLSGSAAARVPESARGFVMNAPDTAVVDLGTEFSLNVDENGASSVFVTDGEVEVSLLGKDGNTLRSERISKSEGVQVRRDLATIEGATAATAPLRVPTLDPSALRVPPEYVDAVRRSQPFAYWRFERLDDGCVANEMGNHHPLTLVMEEGDQCVQFRDGSVILQRSPHSRYFWVDGGVRDWNSGSYSIEVWGCPQRLHWGALLDVLNEDWSGDLNTVEIRFYFSLIHPPGAFRFFHRYPPSQDAQSGINLFDRQTCTPGQWSHIVATKSPRSLRLFVNGELINEFEGAVQSDHGSYQICVGQMDRLASRQFEGALDELALYRRELTAEEVLQHYQLLKMANED